MLRAPRWGWKQVCSIRVEKTRSKNGPGKDISRTNTSASHTCIISWTHVEMSETKRNSVKPTSCKDMLLRQWLHSDSDLYVTSFMRRMQCLQNLGRSGVLRWVGEWHYFVPARGTGGICMNAYHMCGKKCMKFLITATPSSLSRAGMHKQRKDALRER